MNKIPEDKAVTSLNSITVEKNPITGRISSSDAVVMKPIERVSTARPSTVAGAVNVAELGNELLQSSISEYKKKVRKDPLLLAKWRAENAAKYIDNHDNGLDNPVPEDRKVFLSGGMSSARRTYHKAVIKKPTKATQPLAPSSGPIDRPTILQNLNLLRSKLLETEHEIERQELKLALLSTTKHYQRPLSQQQHA
jgi:hypothetical protein